MDAQANLEREREAYWAAKKPTQPDIVETIAPHDIRVLNRTGQTINGEAVEANRANLRAAGRRGPGMIWSRRRKAHRPKQDKK